MIVTPEIDSASSIFYDLTFGGRKPEEGSLAQCTHKHIVSLWIQFEDFTCGSSTFKPAGKETGSYLWVWADLDIENIAQKVDLQTQTRLYTMHCLYFGCIILVSS